MTEPGVYDGMSAAEYHADPCPAPSLSRSVAQALVDRSPAHARYLHPKLNPALEPETSNTLAMGQLCHKLMLGEGADVAVCDEKDWRKNVAKEFRAEAIGRGEIPVTAPQYEAAMKIVGEHLRQMPEMGKMVAERVWIAQDAETGIWLRAMTDWSHPEDALVYDYKTTQASAEPHSLGPLMGSQGYDFQQAFYERVIVTLKPHLAGRIRFRFIFGEVNPPYGLSVVEIAESDVEIARRKVEAAIVRWEECLRADRWPCYGSRVQRVTLPAWRGEAWLAQEMEEEEA